MQTLLCDTSVCLALVTDGRHKVISPKWIVWKNNEYRVHSLNMVYSERRGTRKIHVFAMNVGPKDALPGTEGTLDMLLEVDSESLAPTLVLVSDGLAD